MSHLWTAVEDCGDTYERQACVRCPARRSRIIGRYGRRWRYDHIGLGRDCKGKRRKRLGVTK